MTKLGKTFRFITEKQTTSFSMKATLAL